MRVEPINLLQIMPHRNPLLLIDGAEAAPGAKSVTAFKNLTLAEGCYRSANGATSAEDLAYPLSLLIESFGQGAGLLLSRQGFLDDASSTHAVVFGEFQAIEIVGHAYPGDCLRHEVHLDYAGPQMAIISGQTRVADRVIVRFGSLKAFLVDKHLLSPEVPHA